MCTWVVLTMSWSGNTANFAINEIASGSSIDQINTDPGAVIGASTVNLLSSRNTWGGSMGTFMLFEGTVCFESSSNHGISIDQVQHLNCFSCKIS